MLYPSSMNYPIPNLSSSSVVANSPDCFLHRATGNLVSVEKTFVGTSGAASTNLFSFTYMVELKAIWGIFTNIANVTAITVASWDVYDGTNTVQLTAAAGTTLSGASLYSSVTKQAQAATALTFNNSSQVRVSEPSVSAPSSWSSSVLTAKNGVTNYIRWTQTTGAVESFKIYFFAAWVCRYPGSSVVAV